jgi:hypothetical protein
MTTHTAKRGDIAITEKVSRGYSMIAGSFARLTITVGTVKSVSRDGQIKRIEPAGRGSDLRPRDWERVHVLSSTRLTDPAAFLKRCGERQTPDPDTWEPFDDMNAVRELARQYQADAEAA